MTLDDLRASHATVLTVTQTARLLTDLDGDHLDERTVRRACEDGQLPCVRVGRRLLIPREPLLALLSTPRYSDGPDATSEPIATTSEKGPRHDHGTPNRLRSA